MQPYLQSYKLYDQHIYIGGGRFIKATEFGAYLLHNNFRPAEVVFYVPGLRYLYLERLSVLPASEHRKIQQLAKRRLPERKAISDSPYTLLQMDEEEITPYDLMGLPLNDFLLALSTGKNINVLIPILHAQINLLYSAGDYWDPVTKQSLTQERIRELV